MNILRPKNLLIVALTQYLLQYLVLVPSLSAAGFEPLLNHWHFFLLVLTTLLIAAGGYVVNDLLDTEADAVNKPAQQTMSGFFSPKMGRVLYVVLNLAGLGIAWYLAGQVSNRALVLIHPAAVLLLFLYSKNFKGMPLVGNVVVAFFCAGVAGVVLFAERDTFSLINENQPLVADRLKWLFGGYVVFAFVSTLLREIVKDIEDLEGDRLVGQRTLPVAWGVPAAKKIAGAVALLMLVGTAIFAYWLGENGYWAGFGFLLLAVIGPLILSIKRLHQAQTKAHFTQLSRLVKWIMLAGLLVLIFSR